MGGRRPCGPCLFTYGGPRLLWVIVGGFKEVRYGVALLFVGLAWLEELGRRDRFYTAGRLGVWFLVVADRSVGIAVWVQVSPVAEPGAGEVGRSGGVVMRLGCCGVVVWWGLFSWRFGWGHWHPEMLICGFRWFRFGPLEFRLLHKAGRDCVSKKR